MQVLASSTLTGLRPGGPTPRRERLSGSIRSKWRSWPEHSSLGLHEHPESFRVGNHPYHWLPHVHATVSGKHRSPDAKKTEPLESFDAHWLWEEKNEKTGSDCTEFIVYWRDVMFLSLYSLCQPHLHIGGRRCRTCVMLTLPKGVILLLTLSACPSQLSFLLPIPIRLPQDRLKSSRNKRNSLLPRC